MPVGAKIKDKTMLTNNMVQYHALNPSRVLNERGRYGIQFFPVSLRLSLPLDISAFQDEMLERRMVAGAVAYSAVFLGDQVQVNLKDATVLLGFVKRKMCMSQKG